MFFQFLFFIVQVLFYFWYATIGPNVDFPIWERKSGNTLVRIYNNPIAAWNSVKSAGDLGYESAKGLKSGRYFSRLHKICFYGEIR
jgi:hypothetical protein